MVWQEARFAASDGADLAVYRWPDAQEPSRGVIAIAHGMAEHAARYDEFARYLNGRGYVVEAHDHRGHGRTARKPEDLGFFAERHGWSRVVSDLIERLADMRARHPGQKLVLFGHSMGSFIAQQVLYQAPQGIDAAILSGSNGKPLPLAALGRYIARLERLRMGRHGRSVLLAKLSFGEFNKRFKPTRTNFDWLSRDAARVDAYIADPLCGFLCSTQMWIDLLDALAPLAKPDNRAEVPQTMPLLIFSGEADPVGLNLSELVNGYSKVGMTRVTAKLYRDGRHEMLNEINRAEVFSDVAAWLDGALAV
jgi:alpha-beta hydrolase superfamily lysophospholipase